MAGRLRPIGEQYVQLRTVDAPSMQAQCQQLQRQGQAVVNAVEQLAHELEQLAVHKGGANTYEANMHRRLFSETVREFSAALDALGQRLVVHLQQVDLLAANAALFHLVDAGTLAVASATYPRLVHEAYERRAPALDGSNPALPRPEPPIAVAQDTYYGPSLGKAAITVRLPPL